MLAFLRPVRWIGRHGSRAVALSLFVGMALPPLSALAKPLLPFAVFLLLLLAFLRIGLDRVVPWARRPRLVILATLWMQVAWPVLMGAGIWALGLKAAAPELALAVMIVAVAPPLMSAPAFALLVGLDGSLSLAVLLAGLAAAPVLAPLMAELMLGAALPLDTAEMALRLAVLVAGAGIGALVLRRRLGEARIAGSADLLDGLNVIVLFVFAVAIMDGVAMRFLVEPWLVLGLLGLTIALALAMAAVTWAVFRPAGADRALVVALAVGNRNMGLMAAAMAAQLPEIAWILFAVGQLPIYMTPLLVQLAGRRLRRASSRGRHPA
ncbi:hypothetical protein [Lutibaculum baratangense]|uniref:Sodium-dependent transporter n=1 Tax=Lutibaculum baratangense AMV1 TaxID=631454 RepID=V4R8G1_9HYPH|nr:hypothetical protein [Lutibaculum baratangense]ESR22456.1 hypothetical protein N177_4186 [Lutibaculum baratangense AMV1]